MLGVLIGVAAVMAVGIFWGGYVAATLWGWFMVPLGVSAIGYWHAVGLGSLMAAFGLGGSSGSNSKSAEDYLIERLVYSTLLPAICLLLGWLAKVNM